MKKKGSWFRGPVVTGLAFVAAIGLLAFSGIGIARAVPAIRTDNEYTSIAHDSIGVVLQENGVTVAGSGRLLSSLLSQSDGKLVFGKEYDEPLRVVNNGVINEFVRVTVRKYWRVPGSTTVNKKTDLRPEQIHLTLNGQDLYADGFSGNGWVADWTAKSVDSPETVVLYYTRLLNSGAASELFADKISIDGLLATAIKTEQTGNTIRHTYKYNGAEFCLDVTVDAVQEHNAQYTDGSGNNVGAIKSAWGRDVTVSGGTLTLN